MRMRSRSALCSREDRAAWRWWACAACVPLVQASAGPHPRAFRAPGQRRKHAPGCTCWRAALGRVGEVSGPDEPTRRSGAACDARSAWAPGRLAGCKDSKGWRSVWTPTMRRRRFRDTSKTWRTTAGYNRKVAGNRKVLAKQSCCLLALGRACQVHLAEAESRRGLPLGRKIYLNLLTWPRQWQSSSTTARRLVTV